MRSNAREVGGLRAEHYGSVVVGFLREVVDVGAGDGALPGFPESTRILECPLSTDGRSRGGDRAGGIAPASGRIALESARRSGQSTPKR